jgi:hypothetical protein
VRYRNDEGRWQEGRTRNISRSGVLLHTVEPLPDNTAIEFVVQLPPMLAGEAAPRLVCRGRVVRSVEEEREGALIAAEFTHYTLARCERDQAAATET